MSYAITVRLAAPFAPALARVRAALKEQGFGVALDADRAVGLLLPCNVLVRAEGPDATIVQALDPQVMVSLSGVADLQPGADEATRRLRAALAAVQT